MRFQDNPVGLFLTIKSCLDFELEMINQTKQNISSSTANQQGLNKGSSHENPPSIVSKYNNLDSRLHTVVVGSSSGLTHIGEINRIRLEMENAIIETAQLGIELGIIQGTQLFF